MWFLKTGYFHLGKRKKLQDEPSAGQRFADVLSQIKRRGTGSDNFDSRNVIYDELQVEPYISNVLSLIDD